MKRRKGLQGIPPDTTYKDARTMGQEYTAQIFLEHKIALRPPSNKPIEKRLRPYKRST